MGSPKTGKTNNLGKVFGNTGTNVVSSQQDTTGPTEVVLKAKAEIPAPLPGLAKASPVFKEVAPDPKVKANKDAQSKAISDNEKKKEEEKDADDSSAS
jgi:hypothetical protein